MTYFRKDAALIAVEKADRALFKDQRGQVAVPPGMYMELVKACITKIGWDTAYGMPRGERGCIPLESHIAMHGRRAELWDQVAELAKEMAAEERAEQARCERVAEERAAEGKSGCVVLPNGAVMPPGWNETERKAA